MKNTDAWDDHSNLMKNDTKQAAESDLSTAGLLTDLNLRGLIGSTIVLCHGEFERIPISQCGGGRDHNPGTMAGWMVGAGITGGQVFGARDDGD